VATAHATCSCRSVTPDGPPGQLEQELAQNAWLTGRADAELVFALPAEERLPAAMRLLGIDFSRLSEDVGHA
jgi:putative transcriptional regulator